MVSTIAKQQEKFIKLLLNLGSSARAKGCEYLEDLSAVMTFSAGLRDKNQAINNEAHLYSSGRM